MVDKHVERVGCRNSIKIEPAHESVSVDSQDVSGARLACEAEKETTIYEPFGSINLSVYNKAAQL